MKLKNFRNFIPFAYIPMYLSTYNPEPAALSSAYVMGWGYTTATGNGSDVLREASVFNWKLSDCQNAYKNLGAYHPRRPYVVTELNVCAGYSAPSIKRGPCKGDSGGPLMQKDNSSLWTVIGIVSWAIGCAEENFPTVYTKISSHLHWIRETVGIRFNLDQHSTRNVLRRRLRHGIVNFGSDN